MTPLIALFLLLVVVIRVMTPEQRVSARRSIVESLTAFRAAASRPRPEYEPFRAALASRTPRVFVTPALAALNVMVFAAILLSPGASGNPETLVRWGGSFGPSTTNGEWWRLFTTLAVHGSIVQLVIATAALVQIGLILERMIGPAAFTAAYAGCGLVAAVAGLSNHPVDVVVGSSGAVAGLYGVLAVILAAGRIRASAITMPFIGIRRLIPAALVFTFYAVASDNVESAGLIAGLIFGFVCVPGLADDAPPARRIAATLAAAVVAAAAVAFPLRGGIVDARPDVAHVVDIERRTSTAYDAAVERFRKGRLSIDALIKMIDQTIVPELHAAGARLEMLDGVPPNQRPLVAEAREFVRLRGESWQLRAQGLKKTNMLSLRQADRTERESFEALEKITAAGEK